MKKILFILLLSFIIFAGCNTPATKVETTTPESLGITSRAILDFINAYNMKPNKEGITEMVIDLKPGEQSLNFVMRAKSINLPLGFGTFRNGKLPMPSGNEAPAASSAAWISPDTLQIRSYLFETPFFYTLKIAFHGNEVSLVSNTNLNMGPAGVMELKGTRK